MGQQSSNNAIVDAAHGAHDAIAEIDAVAQSALKQIEAIAKVTLAALEARSLTQNPELIASVLTNIWTRANEARAMISGFVEDAEALRET